MPERTHLWFSSKSCIVFKCLFKNTRTLEIPEKFEPIVTFLHYSNIVILSPTFQTSSYFERPIWLGKSGFQWVPLTVLLGWISAVKPSPRVVHSRERRNLSREWPTRVRLKFRSGLVFCFLCFIREGTTFLRGGGQRMKSTIQTDPTWSNIALLGPVWAPFWAV